MSEKATIRTIEISFDGGKTLSAEFDIGHDVTLDFKDVCEASKAAKKAIFDYLNRSDVKKYT